MEEDESVASKDVRSGEKANQYLKMHSALSTE
jgi:hypothetical protein